MTKRIWIVIATWMLIIMLHPGRAMADAIAMSNAMNASSIAEVFIESDRIRVELEIGFDDIKAFRNILPDNIYERLMSKKSPLVKRLQTFFHEDFVLTLDDKVLTGKLASIEPRMRRERDRVTGQAKDKATKEKVIFAVLIYRFANKPALVRMQPPRNRPVSIGFVAYHRGIPINDFRYLTQPETVTLDWRDPWYSKFSNKYLWRQYNEPLSAFLYIEPMEVRKEIIIRPLDIQENWLDLGLNRESIITPKQKKLIKHKVAQFLQSRNPVLVDGQIGSPTLSRISFVRRSLSKTQIVDQDESIPAISATLGVIYVYPVSFLPKTVSMQWQMFGKKIPRVYARAIDEAGGMPSILRHDDSILIWNNYLKSPTVPALVKIKPPSQIIDEGLFSFFSDEPDISEQEAHQVLLGLLKNIYHAFDYRDESDIYDVLANSTTGDLLTQIYVETQQSLLWREQGDIKVKVKEVKITQEKVHPIKEGVGFSADTHWQVSGSVGHWGHLHQRKNKCHAKITVQAVDGVWKVTRFDLLSEERL